MQQVWPCGEGTALHHASTPMLPRLSIHIAVLTPRSRVTHCTWFSRSCQRLSVCVGWTRPIACIEEIWCQAANSTAPVCPRKGYSTPTHFSGHKVYGSVLPDRRSILLTLCSRESAGPNLPPEPERSGFYPVQAGGWSSSLCRTNARPLLWGPPASGPHVGRLH